MCEAVIAGIAPSARVVHLSHGVPRRSVAHGARMLAEAIPYVPVGVHVAVVDPGVGSGRRAVVLVSADDRRFVGPDNGLLVRAAERCGGVEAAHEIANEALVLPDRSATFDGRDVFAPVAAHLALGVALEAVGPALDPASLVRTDVIAARVEAGEVHTHCEHVDGFGNLSLGASSGDLDAAGFEARAPVRVLVAGERRGVALRARTFADVSLGELVLYEDSRGAAAIAVNGGDASRWLGCTAGDGVTLQRDGR